MKNCTYKLFKQFKATNFVTEECNYFEFAFTIPIKLMIENIVWKIFKKDVTL